nr:MAG TPA: hypothetical protein [Caudoviricetes sp.]
MPPRGNASAAQNVRKHSGSRISRMLQGLRKLRRAGVSAVATSSGAASGAAKHSAHSRQRLCTAAKSISTWR